MPYYVERTAIDGPDGVRRTRKALLTAFRAQVENKGYCFVEILAACPTYQRLSPVEALRFVGEDMARQFPVRAFRREGKTVDA
jgi:2-oxoisovalerate ferredoxin oxidoreductase beta subunit